MFHLHLPFVKSLPYHQVPHEQLLYLPLLHLQPLLTLTSLSTAPSPSCVTYFSCCLTQPSPAPRAAPPTFTFPSTILPTVTYLGSLLLAPPVVKVRSARYHGQVTLGHRDSQNSHDQC